jgi:hypothetical protein
LLGAACLTACAAPLEMNGFKVDRHDWQQESPNVLTRASFDMKCAKDKLELTVLAVDLARHPGFGAGEAVSQMGVTGCGQTMVYVWTPSGWVANIESHDAKPSPPAR